ncbi:hypothetical protein, partial [Pseudomonas sp. SST3]
MKIFSPLPGEYVASALKRGNELLGIKYLLTEDFYIKPVPRIGFGTSKSDKIVKAEWRDHSIFEYPKFLTEHNIAEDVLNYHTLYPLTAALGRSRGHTIITPKYNWMRICPDCVLEDYEIHGTAYIHRRHVQISVQVCSIHGLNLIETCPSCSIPVSKHEINRLGLCRNKYKSSIRQLNSSRHMYAKFIADMLNYRGVMIKRDLAEFIVDGTTFIKYKNEIERKQEYLDIFKIIKRELGLQVRNTNFSNLSDNNFAISAFLGCGTAERYL